MLKNRLTPDLINWTLLCLAIGGAVTIFLSLSTANRDAVLMPLDDTYIHFQYASQMANGEPYQYISGDEATSGATSLLYTPLLAVGYLVGFKGLDLAMWALGWGILAHVFASWMIYKLMTGATDAKLTAILLTLSYAVGGAFVWAALSGMETSIFVALVVASLFWYQRLEYRYALVFAALCALMRPEGAVVALTMAVAVGIRRAQDAEQRWNWLWLALPLLAIGIQPLVTYALTGSFSASGNLAKSHLYNVTIPSAERLNIITENVINIWVEMFSGSSPVDGWYIFPLLTAPAGVAMLLSVITSVRQRYLSPGFLVFLWLVGFSIMIGTLDTAFWHFKRYQLPMFALLFPLAGWFVMQVQRTVALGEDLYFRGFALLVLVLSLYTTLDFAGKYDRNVDVVENQQLAMAEWVRDNLPADARIAVHDVGMMAYIAEARTYDVVGLTTPDTAAAWRQGAGAIYETMANHPYRPDYVAIYPDVNALPFLVEAGVIGDPLATFFYELPENTVASATSTQIVAPLNFEPPRQSALQPTTQAILGDAPLLGWLNVGDLDQEAAWDYLWANVVEMDGFASDLRRFPYLDCVGDCTLLDSTRVILGSDQFALPPSDSDYLVVMRLHAASYAELIVGCDTAQRYIVPDAPAHWVEIVVPVAADQNRFCVVSGDTYYPAGYGIYAGTYQPDVSDSEAIAQFEIGETTIDLLDVSVTQSASALQIDAVWRAAAKPATDGKIFIHLIGDSDTAPVAQVDSYWVNGSLPGANWLGGTLNETYVLNLDAVESGTYTLQLGIYDPRQAMRYPVISDAYETTPDALILESEIVID